ncbi:MAG: phosphoribosylaminoimidazolesuccinocarboxamide synthase [Candidatus Anammoxibacter sp.]
MLVKKPAIIPVECVVSGYLSGSGLTEYKKTQSVYGIKLPEDIVNKTTEKYLQAYKMITENILYRLTGT